PVPAPAEAVAAAAAAAEEIAEKATESLWEAIDQTSIIISERGPQFHEALRVFFLALRDRLYGPKEPNPCSSGPSQPATPPC
ncbi:MAG: hypothetical protein K2Q23_05090, partial [Bryobacteraceae bacterium]|nr:hypothetical protein [Bryobacteraceae bacterium]